MYAKSKRKHEIVNLIPYWRILLPLTIVLIIGIRFPVRILLRWELNFLLYGGIVLGCLMILFKLWRFRDASRIIMSLVLLCGILASVQLGYSIIRQPHTYPLNSSTLCRNAGDLESWDSGLACHFYVDYGCFVEIDRYLGTHLLAISTGESYQRLACE